MRTVNKTRRHCSRYNSISTVYSTITNASSTRTIQCRPSEASPDVLHQADSPANLLGEPGHLGRHHAGLDRPHDPVESALLVTKCIFLVKPAVSHHAGAPLYVVVGGCLEGVRLAQQVAVDGVAQTLGERVPRGVDHLGQRDEDWNVQCLVGSI